MEIFDKTKKFTDLGISQDIADVLDKFNFKHPTQIQSQSLPYSLQGKDIIGLAETGSGKTLAFLLPILEDLLKKPRSYHSLVLSPTRELSQ